MRDLVFNEFWFPLEGLARGTLCRVALTKLASAMASALRRRGVPDPAASLAAEVGAAAFGTAYTRWLSEPDEYDEQDLSRLIRETLSQLKVIIAGT